MKARLFLPALVLLAACGDTDEPVVVDIPTPAIVQKVTISGAITNPKTERVAFTRAGEPVFGSSETLAEAELDTTAGSKFSVSFELDAPSYVSFGTSSETSQMYVSPGDSIVLTIDTDLFDESLTYTGNGAVLNNYLAKKYLMEEAMGQKMMYWDVAPEKYIAWSDSTLMAKYTFMETELKDAPDFLAMEKRKASMAATIQNFNYPNAYDYYHKDEDYELPAGYWDFTSEIKFEDGTQVDGQYFSLISSFVDHKFKAAKEADPEVKLDHLTFTFETTDGMVPPKVREMYLANKMGSQIRYNGASKESKSKMEQFRAAFASSEYLKNLDEKMAEWAPLAEGEMAPDFTASTLDGTDKKLSDYKGKLVYIDVWATWCGPCMRELPFLEGMQEDFAKKDIVFMSVSMDDNKQAWEKMVPEKNMQGEQLWMEGGWKANINDLYKVTSIPRFLLIDEEGKIITVHAPRPSSGEELTSLIEANLPDKTMLAVK